MLQLLPLLLLLLLSGRVLPKRGPYPPAEGLLAGPAATAIPAAVPVPSPGVEMSSLPSSFHSGQAIRTLAHEHANYFDGAAPTD